MGTITMSLSTLTGLLIANPLSGRGLYVLDASGNVLRARLTSSITSTYVGEDVIIQFDPCPSVASFTAVFTDAVQVSAIE